MEQQNQFGADMSDQQLDHEVFRASMQLTSLPLNDLLLEATLISRGEYLSLFRHYYAQVVSGKTSEEVCDSKWLLNEGRGTDFAAAILEVTGGTVEEVQGRYRDQVPREWRLQDPCKLQDELVEELQASSVHFDEVEDSQTTCLMSCMLIRCRVMVMKLKTVRSTIALSATFSPPAVAIGGLDLASFRCGCATICNL